MPRDAMGKAIACHMASWGRAGGDQVVWGRKNHAQCTGG